MLISPHVLQCPWFLEERQLSLYFFFIDLLYLELLSIEGVFLLIKKIEMAINYQMSCTRLLQAKEAQNNLVLQKQAADLVLWISRGDSSLS